MTDTCTALLVQVRAAPADTALRLVYADALDEARGGDAAYAQFIRLACRLEELCAAPDLPGHCAYGPACGAPVGDRGGPCACVCSCLLCTRTRTGPPDAVEKYRGRCEFGALVHGHANRWRRLAGGAPEPGGTYIEWDRGFVATVSVPAAALLARGGVPCPTCGGTGRVPWRGGAGPEVPVECPECPGARGSGPVPSPVLRALLAPTPYRVVTAVYARDLPVTRRAPGFWVCGADLPRGVAWELDRAGGPWGETGADARRLVAEAYARWGRTTQEERTE